MRTIWPCGFAAIGTLFSVTNHPSLSLWLPSLFH